MCPDLILGHPAWVPEQPARPSININNNNNNNDNNDLQAFQLIVLANPKHDLYEMVLMMTDMLAVFMLILSSEAGEKGAYEARKWCFPHTRCCLLLPR